MIRDIRSGSLTKWYLIFLPIAFGVCRGIQCDTIIDSMIDDGQMYTYGTVIDYIMFAMQGMSVYKFNPTEYFSIPIYWFIFQMGAFYIVAYYAFDDFKKNGRAVFVALGERKSWWLAKCLWCNIMVLFYFVVAYISVAVMAWLKGASMMFAVTQEFVTTQFSPNVFSMTHADIILVLFILPFIVTLASAAMQMMLSFLIDPVISFAVTCSVYVISAYYTVWYLCGSYTMWIRSSYVDENGVYPVGGIIFSITIIAISYIMGRIYFDGRDII
ncbi:MULTISPECIES: hypothetical protein [Coprococcus]|uniref:hypothetical protein n=1 Tax=Coprococcus TaxID=33042 RepID=UPI0012E1673C|nr:hypothetical protein [Coprococcus eutactus]